MWVLICYLMVGMGVSSSTLDIGLGLMIGIGGFRLTSKSPRGYVVGMVGSHVSLEWWSIDISWVIQLKFGTFFNYKSLGVNKKTNYLIILP